MKYFKAAVLALALVSGSAMAEDQTCNGSACVPTSSYQEKTTELLSDQAQLMSYRMAQRIQMHSEALGYKSNAWLADNGGRIIISFDDKPVSDKDREILGLLVLMAETFKNHVTIAVTGKSQKSSDLQHYLYWGLDLSGGTNLETIEDAENTSVVLYMNNR
ncbi:hypothetical protein [Pseudoxanthomonas winnipegensis]|uniref:Uncharacterized protein n=1 Tax=Pseudoxanthomonas winnipegensis TaxID=2480810 RepID=A0A4V2HFX9_9GAMM|nr:hypothetical protein [Pseudoxanthomonas winnipegensis]TAA41536.1 hypothetical protein EA655_11380 [Pseudoxanthomonas winnipegensis]